MSSIQLPIISLDVFLSSPSSPQALAEARKAADALETFGALLVRDARVSEDDNKAFLDMVEDYFAQPEEVLRKDERPEFGYQVGATLEGAERPKCKADVDCTAIVAALQPSERPQDITGADPKCRFFHRLTTPPPYASAFPSLSMPNVTPSSPALAGIWEARMEKWGRQMKDAVEGVAMMAAVGLGLEREAWVREGQYGNHLLAPTASDLVKYGKEGTILAGFHTDLNFLTIHGKSRFPGLHIWARNAGKKLDVRIPDGCLLVQAGKQLEHLTGGKIMAGYHEVVVKPSTIAAIERARLARPSRPLIRISSTFFWHLNTDFVLPSWEQEEGRGGKYEEMMVGEQVQRELGLIELMPAAVKAAA